jgi:hypothetical protein
MPARRKPSAMQQLEKADFGPPFCFQDPSKVVFFCLSFPRKRESSDSAFKRIGESRGTGFPLSRDHGKQI